ncbi:hypothetical protein MIR68_010849 [Amoeboaphelidium protococcarum]|nr:hypothetical protein MIR68_010849 [Amoeboaphelidium protococcarum]
MPFLNVIYGGMSAEIKTDGIERIGELRRAIKEEYNRALAEIDAPRLQLYNSSTNDRIATMADFRALPNAFYVEGGPCIEIRTSPPPSKQPSLVNIVPFPPNSGAVHEGLPDAAQKPVIDRAELVKKISDIMERQMSLLITSPSFTGKTALANLMYNHWQRSGKNVHFISFANYTPEMDIDEFFSLFLGQSALRIMATGGILIMDETQNIYSHPTFWSNLKSGAQGCRVLAFGVFGLSTLGFDRSPLQFQLKWYYDDVKFSDQECMELIDKFKQYKPIAREILVPEVIGDLLNKFLNYHPGLVYLALHTICYEFTRTPYCAKEVKDIRLLMMKGKLLSQLYTARCFAVDYDKIKQMLGRDTDKDMNALIHYDSIPLDDNNLDLHRYGICIADRSEGTLKFASEIMRFFYRDLYYKATYGVSGRYVITNWTGVSAHTLLKRILELFNPRVFLNTQAIGRDGRIYERLFQDEFYRCCYLLAPSKCHPDVGAKYSSTGFIDFYIDDELQWGFELLRNGNRLREHMDRFDPTIGRYKDIPLNDYAVVDFYEVFESGDEFVNDKYFKVVFSSDFSSVELSHNGQIEHIVCGQPQQ